LSKSSLILDTIDGYSSRYRSLHTSMVVGFFLWHFQSEFNEMRVP